METFLSALAPYSDAQVERACAAFMRRNSPFPPSAGELAHECGLTVVYEVDQEKLARYRAQGTPKSAMSEEEREAAKARVAKLFADFKAGLPPKDDAIWKGSGSIWKPPPLGSLIADDLMALMPVQPMTEQPPEQPAEQPAPEPVLEEAEDGPLF